MVVPANASVRQRRGVGALDMMFPFFSLHAPRDGEACPAW
jgi:hypothetical protein